MNEDDKKELAEVVALAVATELANRKPSWWEVIRKSLAQVFLSGLGAAVAIIIGFFLNGVKTNSEKAVEAAKEAAVATDKATAAMVRMEEDAKKATAAAQGSADRNGAAIELLKKEYSRVDAQMTIVLTQIQKAVGDKVDLNPSLEQVEQSKTLLDQKQDKEIYRLQQQRAIDAVPQSR